MATGPFGCAWDGSITSTFWMTTGLSGASDLKGPKEPVGVTPVVVTLEPGALRLRIPRGA